MTQPIAGLFPDPGSLISSFGTAGVILIVFAETGLLIGFFLPGDSLLFLAGALCATKASDSKHLDLGVILPGVVVAALVGAQVGYLIGRTVGPRLFDKPESRLFKRKNVERAHEVLHKYGEGKAIFLGRFIPVVRTFMNPVAGVAEVPARTFLVWNIAGGLVWSIGVTLLGYALGSSIDIDHYILPITAVIIILSAIPVGLEIRKQRREAAAEKAGADYPAAPPPPTATPTPTQQVPAEASAPAQQRGGRHRSRDQVGTSD